MTDIMQPKITETSKEVFKGYADSAAHWNDMPLVDGSPSERGNLTQLKRAGLIRTFSDDDSQTLTWMQFTPAGAAYATQLGYTVRATYMP
jgi:hypothetical protein